MNTYLKRKPGRSFKKPSFRRDKMSIPILQYHNFDEDNKFLESNDTFISLDFACKSKREKNLFIEVRIESLFSENMPVSKITEPNGIKNEGSTCYVNSQMQCLYAIAPIRDSVMNYPEGFNDRLMHRLQDLFYEMRFSKRSETTARNFLIEYGFRDNDFDTQKDVNEFNCEITDILEK